MLVADTFAPIIHDMNAPKTLLALSAFAFLFACSSEPATESTPATETAAPATEQSAKPAAPAEQGTSVNVNGEGVEVKSNVGDLSVSPDSVRLTLPKK